MRKLLLVLFLFALTSNALAEDNKWVLVIVFLNPSVMSDNFEYVNPTIFVYDSKDLCEKEIIKEQESNGGIIKRDPNNLMVLEQDIPPRGNDPQYHSIMVCSELDIVDSH